MRGVLTLVAVFSLGACHLAPLPTLNVLKPAPQAEAPVVVVLESSKNELSDVVIEAFLSAVDAKVLHYASLKQAQPGPLAEAITATHPNLVVTLGPAAALFARDRLPNIPNIFALVINYQSQNLQGTPRIMGIAMETAPTTEFTQFKMVFPGLRRVLIPYTAKKSDALARAATEQLKNLDIESLLVAVESPKDLRTLKDLSRNRVDAIWLPSDTLVLSSAKPLIALARANHVPLVASVSGDLARYGALACIAVDIPSIGMQAANMANAFLTHQLTTDEIGIQPPIGTRLVVNTDVAKESGVDIPLEVLPFIGETATGMVSDVTPHP